jgi:ubiquinone/menaquinone biosynthesis C-methylase UbiE
VFTRSAQFYDAIYSFKDYRREVDTLCGLLKDKLGGKLLDVACGTGQHLQYLRNHFDCEGLDLDEHLLAIAREKVPGLPLHQDDMTDFSLDQQFDVITCLFSSIGYAVTIDNLRAALACFADHLHRGGVAVVEPWFAPEQWDPQRYDALFIDHPDLKLARMSRPGKEGQISTIQFEYLISTRDGIERASEHHTLGLFTREQYLDAFERAGFQVEYLEDGLSNRGLYVARR